MPQAEKLQRCLCAHGDESALSDRALGVLGIALAVVALLGLAAAVLVG